MSDKRFTEQWTQKTFTNGDGDQMSRKFTSYGDITTESDETAEWELAKIYAVVVATSNPVQGTINGREVYLYPVNTFQQILDKYRKGSA